ncbi:MAG TPA: YbhN family protein [Acidimicrobiales bacterium]|nr:YbhN family protein [Acidimicrobiales bacterium]
MLRRFWPVLRWVFGLVVLALVLDVLNGHGTELSGFGTVLEHLRWWWLPAAILFEAASLASFAGVQYRLLEAGGLRPPVTPLMGITLASQAITNSLPGGTAVAAVYGFRWYRRLGADDGLAGWAMVGSAVAAALGLALVAAGGLVLATEQGATLDLIPVVLGVLAVTLAVGALFVYERPVAIVVTWALRTGHRLTGFPRGDLEASIEHLVERVTVVRLRWREIGVVVGLALCTWLFDCSCFALSFLMVGVGIPWKGLLLAYGAGQLAANLPITPGGLGAVEGSLTIALAYFGGAQAGTVDAVLVYRLISFWGVLVVGWLAWGWGALGVRRGRWPRHALEAPVEVPTDGALAVEPQPAVSVAPSDGAL